MPRREHVPALDGLRGIAILLVLVFHAVSLRPPLGGSAAARVLLRLGSAGWCGVDLFFVLSGYLITGILLDTLGEPHALRRFWIRRAVRIFPLYYATLFVLLVVLRGPLAATTGYQEALSSQGWFWAYLQNWREAAWGRFPMFDPLRHLWSLAVEEQFYLVWPALLMMVSRRRLIPLCLGLITVASLSRMVLWLVPGDQSLAAYVLTPTRVDALAAGALVAALARGAGGLQLLRRRALLVAAGSMLGLAALLVRGLLVFRARNGELLGSPLLWLLFSSLLILTLTLPSSHPWMRLLQLRPLRFVGKVSYGLYLLHLPLMDGLLALWPGLSSPGFLLVGSAVSLGAAWLTWTLFEKPILSLKDRLAPPPASRAARFSPELPS